MSNFKNRAVPTNPFIAQHLLTTKLETKFKLRYRPFIISYVNDIFCLICIFMNINEKVKNCGKMMKTFSDAFTCSYTI